MYNSFPFPTVYIELHFLRWFGLILIPFISYAADGTVSVVYFIRHLLRHYLTEPTVPTTLARGESIDISIQFALFWMPFFVLLAWWTGKPLTLLFGMWVHSKYVLEVQT
jgi:Ca2+:H+ antiporter